MNNSLSIQYKLLGSLMKNSDLFSGIEHLVRPNIFTTTVTKKSYEIIKQFHAKNIEPDIILIHKSLHKLGIDTADLAEVGKFETNSRLSEGQVKEYVDSLFLDYTADYISKAAKTFILNASDADPIEEMLKIKDAITNVELALNGVSKERGVKTQFREAVQRLKDLKSGVTKRAGFSWGIRSLDQRTLGIVQGINIVAATKGGGKSTIIINVIIENVLLGKLPMLFFSMEMPAIEVLTNVISNVRQINSENLRRGNVEDFDMSGIEDIENSLNEPMFVIDETGGITHQYFEAKVREFRKKNKIPYSQTILVALDYLGLMQNSADEMRMSKEERIEQICTQLMRICKNENIALLKLAQFSRELDKRGNDSYSVKNDSDRLNALRPKMSDLKGSAAIESNAIKILLLYRPEYYGILECDGIDFKGKCEIIIAKDRYGRPGKKMVGFEGKYSMFYDLEPEKNIIITTGENKF